MAKRRYGSQIVVIPSSYGSSDAQLLRVLLRSARRARCGRPACCRTARASSQARNAGSTFQRSRERDDDVAQLVAVVLDQLRRDDHRRARGVEPRLSARGAGERRRACRETSAAPRRWRRRGVGLVEDDADLRRVREDQLELGVLARSAAPRPTGSTRTARGSPRRRRGSRASRRRRRAPASPA